MTPAQDQPPSTVNLGSNKLWIIHIATAKALAKGEPSYRFLVQCSKLEDSLLPLARCKEAVELQHQRRTKLLAYSRCGCPARCGSESLSAEGQKGQSLLGLHG